MNKVQKDTAHYIGSLLGLLSEKDFYPAFPE